MVRESLSGDLVQKLIADIVQVAEQLFEGAGPSVPMSQVKAKSRENNKGDKSEHVNTQAAKVRPAGVAGEDHALILSQENTSSYARPC